ncbi:MAG: hypothetical protein JWM93_2683 [Frankiales bacterium]|nr:hypothetical protein [Frankiales bacterium]
MAWLWRYTKVAPEDAGEAGDVPSPKAEQFPTQSDAETWLGENWRELRAAGVVSATLVDGDRVVYGPMRLEV